MLIAVHFKIVKGGFIILRFAKDFKNFGIK